MGLIDAIETWDEAVASLRTEIRRRDREREEQSARVGRRARIAAMS